MIHRHDGTMSHSLVFVAKITAESDVQKPICFASGCRDRIVIIIGHFAGAAALDAL
jgi:hypothetical protein